MPLSRHLLANLFLPKWALVLSLQVARQPAVQKIERRLGLVKGRHVSGLEDLEEGQVAVRLQPAVVFAILAGGNLDSLALSFLEALVAGPLELVGPSPVTEPVADEVSIASIDEDRDLVENLGDQSEVRLHPITLEQEVAVNVKVAAVVLVNLGAESLHDFGLVQPLRNVLEFVIAKAAALAVTANIVRVAAAALVRTNHGIIAVDTGGYAGPGTLGIIARFDQRLAAGEGVVQGLAGALVQDSRVATITASHWAVVLVLSVAIGQSVSNQNALEINVAILVG